MADGVEIAGVGIHPFGRFDGVSNTDMGVHAVRAALAVAGDPVFDAAFCGTAYGGVASGHKVLGALARTGMPIVDVEAGCASGGAALQLAARELKVTPSQVSKAISRLEEHIHMKLLSRSSRGVTVESAAASAAASDTTPQNSS